MSVGTEVGESGEQPARPQAEGGATPTRSKPATEAALPGRRPARAGNGSAPNWLRVLILLALLIGCAGLFVGSDVLERQLIPTLSTGWRHALLTLRAALVIAVGCSIVFLFMRTQHRRLTHAAEQLSNFLESYTSPPSVLERFNNPHVAHCRDVLDCHRADCPMFNKRGQRCWQVIALTGAERGADAPAITLQQCHECAVYRQSCPDRLTELGESFNNLMFLLEEEAHQVGRMRAQMVEREKMAAIGQIAAGIAHEVGNPLSSISSIVQMLKRNRNGSPPADQLDLIQTHIRRISDTVRELATIARPAADRWRAVRIGLILDEAIHLVRFDRRARHVTIDHRPGLTLPTTIGLPDQLQQVFINLLLNALDAMPGGGELRIHAQKRRKKISVTIQDTGCGVPSSIRKRIFEPFFTTKPPGQGTGLGLAVSQGIVQKHGGTIDCVSTPGEGTTFSVLIPIGDKPPDTTHEPKYHTPR